MQNSSFDQCGVDTALFSAYAVLRESGCCDTVVIDATDTDAYVAAAVISSQLPSVLSSSMTGCDANSGFYCKGKKSVYDQVAKSPVARRQLSRCGESHDLGEDVVEQFFEFTQYVTYGDNKSDTIAVARAAKWKNMKNKSCIRLPPDADRLLGISNAPPVPEAPHLATRTWLGADGWSLPTRDLFSRRNYLHQGQ